MNEEARKSIYDNLDLRETEDLLKIWQTNDRVEWEATTFEIVHQILQERQVDLPPQNEPVYKHQKIVSTNPTDTNPEGSKFFDPANAPEFYKPREVFGLAKYLKQAALVIIVVTIFRNLLDFQNYQNLFLSYFANNPNLNSELIHVASYFLAILLILVDLAVTAIIYYFPLRALGEILKILTEMEFRSRGV
jgi:hypothetical protein